MKINYHNQTTGRDISGFFLIVVLLIIALHLDSFAQTPLKLFLMAGQSNMLGVNSTVGMLPADLQQPQTNVKAWATGLDGCFSCRSWGPLKVGMGSQYGPEITFGHDMAQDLPHDSIAIFKAAVNGSSLYYNWLPPSSGGVNTYFQGMLIELDTAIARLGSHYKVEISGMCWLQGETDGMDPNHSVEYQTNLSNFIKDLRSALKIPDLPFVIAKIDSPGSWQYASNIRKSEDAVAKTLPYVGIFDTEGFPTDGMHYKDAGLQECGSAFATAMLPLLSTTGTRKPLVKSNAGKFSLAFNSIGAPKLQFSVPTSMNGAPIKVSLFNMSGKLVRTIVNGRLTAGSYEKTFNGLDNRAIPLPAGGYICRLEGSGITETVAAPLVR